MTEPAIELGRFTLDRQIGEGGMGEVWLAHAPVLDQQVAIKVISAQLYQTKGDTYDRQFVQEVNAVAKLNHESICRVFDFGYIGESASTTPSLRQGAPWFAMEYASGGTLEDLSHIQNWDSLKACLIQLLQGLAHAHARGLIHRDIKPANVLVFSQEAGPRYAFTDFGLALPLEMNAVDEDALSNPMGTPFYMSPEQFSGHWRDFGPWTDLYAMGAMAYELCCGLPPFTGHNLIALAMEHSNDPVPPLTPRFDVPSAFSQWIQTLMAKDPLQRYTRAADALWALMALPQTPLIMATEYDASSQPGHAPTSIRPRSNATIDGMADTIDTIPQLTHDTQRFDPQALMRISQSDHASGTSRRQQVHLYHARPPLPMSWRTDARATSCVHLSGAGLFSMRTTPFVGRESERDMLWQKLTETIQQHTPKLVCITGDSGTGKSRLAQWMTQRIEELGAAFCIHIHHDQRPGPTHGMGYAFERILHCRGLDSEAACARVFNWLSHRTETPIPQGLLQHTAKSIVAMMDAKHAHLANFSNVNERYAALVLALSIISQERPVVLWLDDMQWSELSSNFVKYLLSAQPAKNLPIYIIGTIRTDTSFPNSLRALLEEQTTTTMTLGTLPPNQHLKFIQKLLPLDRAIASRLADRTQGNPLFAIQILHNWLNNDLLALTAEGFSLKMDTLPDLPVALHDLWQQRLMHVLNQGHGDQLNALEVASCLGSQVKLNEWRAICEQANYPLDQAFLDLLQRNDLIDLREEGIMRFAHNLLRESIEQQAKRNERWAIHHQHCATYLTHTPHAQTADTQLRCARHLMEAGHLEASLDRFERSAKQLLEQSNYPMATVAHDAVNHLCDLLGYPDNHTTRLYSHVHHAEVLRYRGEMQRSYELVKAVERSVGVKDIHLKAHLLRLLAGLRISRNRILEAEALISFASQLYEQCDDTLGQAKCQHGLGWNYMLTKRLTQARIAFEKSHELGQHHQDQRENGWALLGLADYYNRILDLEQAQLYTEKAVVCFEQSQTRAGLCFAQRTQAGILLFREQWQEALDMATLANMWLHQVESPMRHMTDLMIAIIHLERQNTEQAHVILLRIAQADDHLIHAIMLASIFGLLCVYAQQTQWDEFDAHLDHIEQLCHASTTSDLHLCFLAQTIATYLLEPEHQMRLRRIKALAKSFVDVDALPELCHIIDDYDTHWTGRYIDAHL